MYFERDIFISYAHIDNVALKAGERGWITDFHRALEVRLAQLLGTRPRIWRDPKLKGNDSFGAEILRQLPKTAAMISILSPVYIKSVWCIKEVRGFYETAVKGIGIKTNNSSRIFKVVKTAVPYGEYPPEAADTLGYEFFVCDPYSDRVKELNQDCGGELEQLYWAKLDDIAHDLRDLLVKLEHIAETGAASPRDSARPGHREHRETHEQVTVYLAETCSGLKTQRDMIKRELLEFGYGVLPDRNLPLAEPEFSRTAKGFLDRCQLSIHLVGGSYGLVPEGSHRSVVPLQNELAAQISGSGRLQRLVWIMPGKNTAADDERQQLFLHRLRTDARTQFAADVVETSIENFKHAIHDKLKLMKSAAAPISAPGKKTLPVSPAPYPAGTGSHVKEQRETLKKKLTRNECRVVPAQPLQIYLICDRQDLDNITGLEDFLYRSEFDVILPAFEGEEADLIRDHRESLKTCDAVLIYYGTGSDLWMKAITRGLKGIAAYGRTRPLLLKAAFLAPPVTASKEHFRSHGIFVIDGMKGFSTQLSEPFVQMLRTMERG